MAGRRLCAVCLLAFTAHAFEVLYVGPPRTGTQTIYTALQLLGMNPLHSGYNLSTREPLCNYLYFNGSKEAVNDLFREVDAGMDEPFQLMYDYVLEEFPDAKFILPVTTAEDWMKSYADFMENDKWPHERRVATKVAKISRLKIKRETVLDYYDQQVQERMDNSTVPATYCWACQYWGCAFGKIQGMSEEENRTCYNNFNAHMERVKATIPASRLLLFNFSDGWAPLCHFLGLPIPDEPFPFTDKFHENPTEEEGESVSSFLQTDLETQLRDWEL